MLYNPAQESFPPVSQALLIPRRGYILQVVFLFTPVRNLTRSLSLPACEVRLWKMENHYTTQVGIGFLYILPIQTDEDHNFLSNWIFVSDSNYGGDALQLYRYDRARRISDLRFLGGKKTKKEKKSDFISCSALDGGQAKFLCNSTS